MRPYITSIREVNRLSNLLQFKLASISQEVNFVDMVSLTTLEIVFPEVYEWIKHNKSLLTGMWEYGTTPYSWDAKEQAIYQESRDELQKRIMKCGYDSTQEHINRLCSCIKTLFPNWSQKSVPHYALDELRGTNRVAHPEKFDRYFNLDINEIVLRQGDIDMAINSMTATELGTYMHELDTQGVIDHLFDIHDLSVLGAELDEYALRADEILSLLFEYDNAICEEFCELCKNVDFSVQAE